MRLTCIVENKAARSDLKAEHGLSFLVEADGRTVLWDTGATREVFLHNLRALGLADKPVDAVALSHAHLDHTGGLPAFLELRPGTPIYAHAAIGTPRFSARDGIIATGTVVRLDVLAERTSVHLSRTPVEIVPGVRCTGDVQPRPYPQGSSPHLLEMRDGMLVTDTYADDVSLILEVDGGIVLLCGCCHAGLRNTLARVRSLDARPLRAIIGGTHLRDADEAELTAIVAAVRREGNPALYLNHCTGDRAIAYLRDALGGIVNPCPAGTVLQF